jgi:nucleoside-diphosphate-sugar epimerase
VRALVTGATGFLGSRVARQLVDSGEDVRVLARPTSDISRLTGLDLTIVHGDVTDRSSVVAATTGVDVVFHCAAVVELGRDRTQMQRVNVDGTRHVLEAAVDEGATVVHVSSVAALGPTGPTAVDENWWAPQEPSVAYEATKREAHVMARTMAAQGAPVRIGIPGGVYGYGDTSSMAKLIEVFVTYPTPVGYMPELVQSLVNVDDCATGLRLIADKGRDGGEYLLCADAVRFREWFEMIAYGAGRRPPFVYVPTSVVRWSSRPAAALTRLFRGNPEVVVDTVEIATRHQAFSGDKARAELGWTPRSLRQGMVEMCGAVRRDNDRRRARRKR